MKGLTGLPQANQFDRGKKRGFIQRKIARLFLLLTFIASSFGPATLARAQTQTPPSKAQALLETMTPEERIGQLFLVTFRGTNTAAESQIYDLIVNHHVGGVVLLAQNDNFLDSPETVPAAHKLISDLQSVEWSASSDALQNQNTYVPLFIGVAQNGDGAPQDQILSGLTPLPSEMALGAAWDPDLAKQTGNVLGNELSALGFNLFFGPSLDVVETPTPSANTDLGTRVFGGDPFWVGKMGLSFITGLHEGSNNRLLVIAKHFPGRGDSDRLPDVEVATVRKSLEQLKQVELPPFFAVTNSADPAGLADGLLVSHIRYQGFQGNIRATTRPVSFDASALSAILSLPEFANWRTNGGLVVSDSLGSEAVRKFYSQGGENFSMRSVARDAFQAGNDLLYLGNISTDGAVDDTYEATVRILEFFAQEYRSDRAFAQRVDEAVTRILAQKYNLYDFFTISNVLSPASSLDDVGGSQQVVFDVATRSATLISPDAQELSALLPAPPNISDRIVFLTDVPVYQQCGTCVPREAFAADSLQKVVDRLYGQQGSGQVFSTRMSSFPLREVELMLNGESETNIESALERATWVVISFVDVNNGRFATLKRFLSERPNLTRNKNVILFSFTAPYYLDATDVSKLTAYYALYSHQPPFVEVAARLLFQQIALQGSSPVSVASVGYDLISATAPNESQVIPLALDNLSTPTTPFPEGATAEPTAIPSYQIGDSINVRAGPIFDHNNHIVPDGTIAHFTLTTRDESGDILQQFDAQTVDGVARASFVIDKPGNVEVRVTSEPALISEALQFDASDAGVAVTVVVPVVSATEEPILPTPTQMPVNDMISPEGYPRIGAWMLALLTLAGGAALVFWAASNLIAPRWALRFALCALIGGLATYNYLALGFPGAADWIASGAGAFGILTLTFSGEIVGVLAAWVWMKWLNAQA
ncbi:MAG: glycoside hydrolase family 3 N-terminal domain-containing protein [Anaerolineales bacterium]